MEQIVSIIVGIIAPFVIKFLNGRGIHGVVMLWIVYGISVALAVAVNLATGTFNSSDVITSVTIIVATAQTIFHGIIKE